MQEYSQGVPAFFISHGFILLLVPSLFNLISHRNHGCFLGLRERKKSLGEIFNEKWPLARNLSSEFKRN